MTGSDHMELRERIQDFWTYFTSIQHDLENDLLHHDEECLQLHRKECNERVAAISGGSIEFEEADGFFEMTLPAYGNRSIQYIHALMKKDAPKKLLDRWIINAYRPPLSEKAFHSMFEVDQKTYQGSDFKIYYEIDDVNRMIPIQVYCKGLVGLDSNRQLSIARTMLELFIGELEVEARISSITVLQEELDVSDVCLLPNFYEDICDIIIDREWVEYHDPTAIYMAYKIDEKISFEGLRKDMKMIVTTFPQLQEEVLNKEEAICRDMKQRGGEYGYLYFANAGVSEKSALVRQQLEKEVHNLLYPMSIARTIGGASGTQYSYIDLLIFDRKAFQSAFEKIRDRLSFDIYYKPFIMD